MPALSIWPLGSRANADAVALTMTWPELAAWIGTPVPTTDKHASGYSPLSAIRPGEKGRIDAGPAGFVAFEYDEGASVAALADVLTRTAELDAVIYTTASATPACPRFRCVLHPSRPIETADEYRACVRTWAGRGVAPESYQMTRLWYRPITSGLMPPVVIRTTGARIDVDDALRLHPPPPPRPPPIARTDDELAAWPLELRVQQAWDALDARRPAGAYAASCVCHDHGLPLHVAEEVVVAYGRRCGWTDLDADAIAGRAANAYQYARDPFGCALTPTSTSHPDLRLRIARLMDLA